ncbi:hypothetical protein ABEB36_010145 [Hypothenemus hampei]
MEHSETKTTNSVYGEHYAVKENIKIEIGGKLLKVLQYIDSNRTQFYNNLADIVKIRSVTGKLCHRNEVCKMINFAEDWLKRLEMKYECFNIGHYLLDGKKVKIPSVILASLGNDPGKKTVCAYLHLDVPDPDLEKWKTDPWTLTNKNNILYGNGTSCGKGPAMMWFHAIQAFKDCNLPLPVNLKLLIELMNHENSLGLSSFLPTRLQDFFSTVYNVVLSESEWIGFKHPCVIYGCVGVLHFEIAISKTENSKTDIRADMEVIAKSLVDKDENILIKEFNEFVEEITPDEEKNYEKIKDFNPDEIRDSLPDSKKSWGQEKLLMSLWRLPSVHVHETMECVCEKEDFSKIKKIITFKIVPRQVVEILEKRVKAHVENVVKQANIENLVTCELIDAKRPWFENFKLPCYNAARRAIIQIYKEDPNMIREPIAREAVTILDRILQRNIVVLPLARRGSNPGHENENISSRNYYEGTKVIAAYLFQLGDIQ